jgi:hydroxypyruvate reductase
VDKELDSGKKRSDQNFLTHSLHLHPQGEQIAQILSSAVAAVEPGAAIQRFVKRSPQGLMVENRVYDLSRINRVFLVAIGKASPAMAAATADLLGERLTAGLVIAKHLPEKPDPRWVT